MDYEIIIPSYRPQLSNEARNCVKNYNNRIFDGTDYPSFSKLINDCINTSKWEKVIICSDKARPDSTSIDKILTMLDDGWGLVAPYRFGFFGFKKDLIRRIGYFDERYIGGGYEDNDFILRLKEADISYYENEEIKFIHLPSSWHYERSNIAANYYTTKWKQEENKYIRRLLEENYRYNIGPFKNTEFLPFAVSVLLPFRGNLKYQIMQVDLLSKP